MTRRLRASEITHIIDEYILDERNRNILKRRLVDNKTYDELSEEFHLCVRQVKTIVSRGKSIVMEIAAEI